MNVKSEFVEYEGRKYRQVTKSTDKCPYKECDGEGKLLFRAIEGCSYQFVSNCTCFWRERVNQRWKETVGAHDQWVRLGKLVNLSLRAT